MEQVVHQGSPDDHDIASHHQRHQPHRQQFQVPQHHESGNQHHLVREWVQPGPQSARRFQVTGQKTVQAIRDAHHDEQDQCQAELLLQQQHGEPRHQKQAQDADQIGNMLDHDFA